MANLLASQKKHEEAGNFSGAAHLLHPGPVMKLRVLQHPGQNPGRSTIVLQSRHLWGKMELEK